MTSRPATATRPEPITLPPYLVGETVQLFIISAAGTRLVDAEVAAFTAHGDGYAMTVHLSPDRETFALVPAPPETADPITQPCAGCDAQPGEPCRWGCLSYAADDAHRAG